MIVLRPSISFIAQITVLVQRNARWKTLQSEMSDSKAIKPAICKRDLL